MLAALGATVLCFALMKADDWAGRNRLVWFNLGHLAAFAAALGSLAVASGRRWLSRAELGLVRHRSVRTFLRGAVEGVLLVVGILLIVQVGARVSGLPSAYDLLKQQDAVYGFSRIVRMEDARWLPWGYALTPVVEELLFRGIWYAVLVRVARSEVAASLGQAVLFAVWHSLHFGVPQPEFVVFGILYGEVRRAHGSILAPLGLHVGWDVAVVGAVLVVAGT